MCHRIRLSTCNSPHQSSRCPASFWSLICAAGWKLQGRVYSLIWMLGKSKRAKTMLQQSSRGEIVLAPLVGLLAFVSKSCGVDAAEVRLVGRLSVPKHSSDSFIEGEQRDMACEKWNYDLYLHRI